MRDDLILMMRILAHVLAVVLGICISLLAFGVIVVALWGTGAFTTALPPEQPGYLVALTTAILWFGAEVVLYLGWKRLVRALDGFELQ